MRITAEEVYDLAKQREDEQGPVIARARQIRDSYNGDIVVPLPEIDSAEAPAVANLMVQGVDQMADRIASTQPGLKIPALRPHIKRSQKYAAIRRDAVLSWWDKSRMKLKLRRRSRHLIAYASSPVIIRPDSKLGIPRWHIRDPLATLPPSGMDLDEIAPPDCIFKFTRSYAWLAKNYPDLAMRFDPEKNPTINLYEYVDDEQLFLCATRKYDDNSSMYGTIEKTVAEEVLWLPNRIGMCPAVVPGRITLDRPGGQFDGMLGAYIAQSKLFALELHAAMRGVFPEEWLVANQGEQNPQIISEPRPEDGIPGIVKGGALQQTQINPNFTALQNVDRLERSQRLSAGIPAEFGGESGSNIRTGRRGDAVLSAVVDFPVQSAQELLSQSLMEENRRAIAVAKRYFGDQPKSFYFGAGNDYTPNEHFETDANIVSYSMSGVDTNGLVISIGQRVGLETMSKRTAQEIDPLIEDPEFEHDQIIAEGLEKSMLQSIEAQAAQGQIPPSDLARIMQLVLSDKVELAAAITQAQREAQERQAAQVQPGAPEAQPGLSMPGMGAEAGTIPQPNASLSNLSQLLGSLRQGQNQTPQEQAVA